MPTYITLYRFTNQGIKKIKESPDRVEKAKEAINKAGGILKCLYLTMGRYDFAAISEWPSDQAAAAFLLGQASQGNVTTETLPAFTEDEFKKIVAKIP